MSRAHLVVAACGLAALGLGACDAIVGAGGRELNGSIVCSDAGGCACEEGFGDCDGIADNGCETDLNDPKNCGACKNDCGNGKCDKLACVCETGFADCDPAVVGCETNLQNEAKHCGTCDRDCLTASCTVGLCDVQVINNTASCYGFAVLDGSLYFTNVSMPGLLKEPVDGSAAPVMFGTSTGTGKIVKIDGDTIFWTSTSEVLSTPLAGGPTQTLVKDVKPQYQVTVGGGKVYWDDLDAMMPTIETLMRVPVQPGGMPEQVLALGDIGLLHDFVASAQHVYLYQDAMNGVPPVTRVAHDSTMIEMFTTMPTAPTLFAADTDALYIAGQASGTFRVPFTGGLPDKIADAAPGYGSLVTDAENIYFLTDAGDMGPPKAVWRAPKKGGGQAVKLAEDPSMFSGQPMSVDDKWVYWLTLSGVARVAR